MIDVNAALVCLATNVDNPINSFVLVKKDQRIPSGPILPTAQSLYIVRELFKDATNINGNWKETQVEQIGFFEQGRNVVVYSLLLPAKVPLTGEYEWMPIDKLSESPDYSVIRYSILKGVNSAVF